MTNETLDALYTSARHMISGAIRDCVIDLNKGVDLHDHEIRGARYMLRLHSINFSKSSTGRGKDNIEITVSYSWQDQNTGKWTATEDDLDIFSCDEMCDIINELEKSNK